jgi:GR25 family glycosyltransferase involved in LPS biosynthesis
VTPWDEAVVINLPERQDRLHQFSAPFPVRVFSAIGGTDRPDWYSSPEALGCALSHRAVLSETEGTTLVLEDDAVVPADLEERVWELLDTVPRDWELLKLGGEHLVPALSMGPITDICKHTARTHAYLVRGDMRERLIGVIDTSRVHWDAAYATLRAYAPRPFLVHTSGSPSSIPGSRPL